MIYALFCLIERFGIQNGAIIAFFLASADMSKSAFDKLNKLKPSKRLTVLSKTQQSSKLEKPFDGGKAPGKHYHALAPVPAGTL